MNPNDFELFKGTTFSDLMRDIYHNSKKKSRQIDGLIQDLKPFVKNAGDATVIVPIIKDYLEVSVKNDDALVKLAAVVQRIVSANSKADEGGEFGLSDEERSRLLEQAEEEIQKIRTTAWNDDVKKVGESANGNVNQSDFSSGS
jgi:hypothetical protein